jgi:hypothetical protein
VTAAKTTNFPVRLPPEQSDLAVQTVKTPYIFDFFDVDGELGERELENKPVGNVTKLRAVKEFEITSVRQEPEAKKTK